MKFNIYIVGPAFALLPPGTTLRLDPRQSKTRSGRLKQVGPEKNNIWRATLPVTFKAGEKLEIEVDSYPKAASQSLQLVEKTKNQSKS